MSPDRGDSEASGPNWKRLMMLQTMEGCGAAVAVAAAAAAAAWKRIGGCTG